MRLLTIAVIGIVVVAGVGGYLLTGGFHRSSSGSQLQYLVAKDSLYSLPGQQFFDVALTAHSTSTVSGQFLNTKGINVFVMTPSEVTYLSEKGVVGSYTWTSGRIANGTVTNFNYTFPAGQWGLVFLNTDNASIINPAINTTIVTIYSGLFFAP